MKFRFRLFVSGIIFLTLSCGFGPPKDMKPDLFLDFAENVSGDIVGALNDFSAFDMTKPYWLPNPLLWHFSSSDEIHFIKMPYPSESVDTAVLCRLGENGEILPERDFYFTMCGNVLAYSFDKRRWFATDGDPREYEAFVPDIRLVAKRDRQLLSFSFTWAVREGNNPKLIPPYETVSFASREIVSVEPNQICYSTDKNDHPVDLHRSVFFVPKGTSVGFQWDVTSNFISLRQPDPAVTVLKPLKDLYFYRKNRIVALGFDGKDYGDTFFSYRFLLKQSVVTDESGHPTVCQKIVLINKNF